MELLSPKTPVRIKDPISKKWDKTGFVVSFGVKTVSTWPELGIKPLEGIDIS
jgi:hypothetical protein